MRILPVFLGINNLNNKDGCKRLTPANYPRMKTSFIQDSVTFGGRITTPNGLKELAKNGVQTDLLYEKDGVKGLWLQVIKGS